MNEEQCMCYITYAVPQSMLPNLMQREAFTAPKEIYPPGFMPDWYRQSSFPEDDIEE